MRKFIKNPYAERIRKNGCTIRITRGEGTDKVIVEERVVTPEEIAVSNAKRDDILSDRRV
ncbi:MAG: hypothetical protein FWD34_01665 [Oscillospiraceae bacterium]|nr:hypothetical protein [Oscillospiraceae bacterium]